MNDDVKNWIQKADNDLKAATFLLNIENENLPTDVICFHCQQSVEKYFKAYLISVNVNFPRTHDLEFLKSLCEKANDTFSQIDISNLDSYSIEIRYPDDFYIPSFEEAKDALRIAILVKDKLNQIIYS